MNVCAHMSINKKNRGDAYGRWNTSGVLENSCVADTVNNNESVMILLVATLSFSQHVSEEKRED